MEHIRYGILSTSSIAPRFIAAVREAEAGEIAALSSRSLEKAREKAAEWDIPAAYGGHQALLDDPAVNTVYISTVNAQHYPWARAALEQGKHVVCEKPCTTSAAATRELFRLAREKGLFLMEAEKMLFLPAVEAVRDRIQRGELGRIHMAEFRHSFPAAYNGWMYDEAAGGGPLLSSAIYVMELVLWLFGGIRRCGGLATPMGNGVEAQYVLSGETESGMLFTAQNSTLAMLQNGARIYGEKGWIDLPDYWKARRAVFHIQGRAAETMEFPCEHELVYEARHIAECLRAGRLNSPVVTEELSVAAISVLEEIREAWRRTLPGA